MTVYSLAEEEIESSWQRHLNMTGRSQDWGMTPTQIIEEFLSYLEKRVSMVHFIYSERKRFAICETKFHK